MNQNEDINQNSIKEALKKKIKEKIKKELLEEIYNELKLEENDITKEISSFLSEKITKNISKIPQTKIAGEEKTVIESVKRTENVSIAVKAILKIASHSLKYANNKIPRGDWVEVIGLLAGKLEDNGQMLHIEDAYPMGHGTAVYAEIKDYKNYVRAYNDIKGNKLFICGWYHSHPSYGLWMSDEDIGTQARYQKLWKDSVALVIDPYQINGVSLGFDIFKADLKTKKWFTVPFKVKGEFDVSILPELLEFINPIVEGKALYLEYDED